LENGILMRERIIKSEISDEYATNKLFFTKSGDSTKKKKWRVINADEIAVVERSINMMIQHAIGIEEVCTHRWKLKRRGKFDQNFKKDIRTISNQWSFMKKTIKEGTIICKGR
jgi:hypothetical protein